MFASKATQFPYYTASNSRNNNYIPGTRASFAHTNCDLAGAYQSHRKRTAKGVRLKQERREARKVKENFANALNSSVFIKLRSRDITAR